MVSSFPIMLPKLKFQFLGTWAPTKILFFEDMFLANHSGNLQFYRNAGSALI